MDTSKRIEISVEDFSQLMHNGGIKTVSLTLSSLNYLVPCILKACVKQGNEDFVIDFLKKFPYTDAEISEYIEKVKESIVKDSSTKESLEK
jgi:hypothetical protein